MNNQIQIQQHSVHSVGIGRQSAADRGQYRGQSVTISAPNHLQAVLDAAEEATMQVSQKAEKRLGERKLASTQRHILVAVRKAREYLEKVPDLERQQKLDDYVQRLLQNPEVAIELLRRRSGRSRRKDDPTKFSEDPTLQYAAMAYAYEALEQKGGEPDLADALAESLNCALGENGEAIRAGLNISQVAHQYGGGELGEAGELRNAYRDAVLDYGGLTATYRKIIATYGEKRFEQYRLFLMEALSADMLAQGSSIPLEKLRAIVDDLSCLKVLGGMHEQCRGLIEKMQSLFQQAVLSSGQQLMAAILDLKDKSWLHVTEVESMVKALGVEGNSGRKIYFLTAIYKLIYLLPEKVYESALERESFLKIAQEALDNAIYEEEQEQGQW